MFVCRSPSTSPGQSNSSAAKPQPNQQENNNNESSSSAEKDDAAFTKRKHKQPAVAEVRSSGSGGGGGGATTLTQKDLAYDYHTHVQQQLLQERQRQQQQIEQEDIDKDQPFWECCLLRWCEGYHACGILIGVILAAFAFTAGMRATQLSQALQGGWICSLLSTKYGQVKKFKTNKKNSIGVGCCLSRKSSTICSPKFGIIQSCYVVTL